MATRTPWRARQKAAHAPAGPAPTTATSTARTLAPSHPRDTLHVHDRSRDSTIHGGRLSGCRVGPEGHRCAPAGRFPARIADRSVQGHARGHGAHRADVRI